jgi:hypothetical protein
VEPLSIKKKNSLHDCTSPISEVKETGIVRSAAAPNLSRGIGSKTPERPSKRKQPPVAISIDVDISLMTDAEREIIDTFLALAERSQSKVSY